MQKSIAEDLYELLGVSSFAKSSELKRAYRKLSLKYHPDKQTPETKDQMKQQFVKIANGNIMLFPKAGYFLLTTLSYKHIEFYLILKGEKNMIFMA